MEEAIGALSRVGAPLLRYDVQCVIAVMKDRLSSLTELSEISGFLEVIHDWGLV